MSERHSIVSMIPAETFRWERKPRRIEWLRVALVGASHRRALDRASGLAFDSAFAAVPSLVVLVDLLRVFDLYEAIRLQVLEPWLLGELAEHNESLGQAFTTLLDVVENANLRALGLTGAPILVYGAYMLMAATEGALNDIFGASRDRSFLHRLRDYLIITVFVMGAALGAGVLAGVVGYAKLGGFVVVRRVGARSRRARADLPLRAERPRPLARVLGGIADRVGHRVQRVPARARAARCGAIPRRSTPASPRSPCFSSGSSSVGSPSGSVRRSRH